MTPSQPTPKRQETPRTDAAEVVDGIRYILQPRLGMPDMTAFARKLESELSTLTTQNAELTRRLEEAEDGLRNVCLLLGFDPSDGEGTTPQEVVESVDGKIRELNDQLAADSRRVDRLEQEVIASYTGVSFDSHRDTEAHEPRMFRFMRHHKLGEFKPSLREALDSVPAAMSAQH